MTTSIHLSWRKAFLQRNQRSRNDSVPPKEHTYIPGPPSKLTVYYPHFWPKELPQLNPNSDLEELASEFKKKKAEDWLTEDLILQKESAFPCEEDITTTTSDGDRIVGKVFVKGRVFAKYCQFDECGKFLLGVWAVQASHAAKSLHCF
jgi:hypothetical protein